MTTRRSALKYLLASGVALKAAASGAQSRHPAASIRRDVDYKRIATEEAYCTPEIIERYRKLIAANPPDEPGFVAMWGAFMRRPADFFAQLNSLGERRLADMDAMGIDMHVLSLTAPGVQVFDAAIDWRRLAAVTRRGLPVSRRSRRRTRAAPPGKSSAA
jgi:hypothetical protein